MAKGAAEIVFLGWGSLLWEPHITFDDTHGPWLRGGPSLRLEFSRISSSRLGALTLVIDADHGRETIVSYCVSKRKSVDDAVADLRCREGTMMKNIGWIQRSGSQRHCVDKNLFAVLSEWLGRQNIDAVIWTNLESNFREKRNVPFSVPAAITYVQSLDPQAKVKAAEYIWRAPEFVQTELREALEVQPWFPRV